MPAGESLHGGGQAWSGGVESEVGHSRQPRFELPPGVPIARDGRAGSIPQRNRDERQSAIVQMVQEGMQSPQAVGGRAVVRPAAEGQGAGECLDAPDRSPAEADVRDRPAILNCRQDGIVRQDFMGR